MRKSTTSTLPALGTPMEGGFFGGVINVGGTHKGVIWAPKAQGQIITRLHPDDIAVEGAHSHFDCAANTQALLAAESPAAQRIAALEINGFKDWLIPSRDVLELGYRHFKPGTRKNYCSWRDGENHNSVPAGWLYTSNSPAQTETPLFQTGGEEAFDEHWYWSSTVLPDGDTAFLQDFYTGGQGILLSCDGRVRAVRLIQLSA